MTAAHDDLLARFVEVCEADDRIVAAFLGGSVARDEADGYSDLDLCIVVVDDAYDEVVAGRPEIVRRLGEPLFCEDFGNEDVTFFILADGTEGELNVARMSALGELAAGPLRPLLDEHDLLPPSFPSGGVGIEDLDEALERTLSWFWHELSHFVAAVGRDQPWWAVGQLEALRGLCVNLVRIEAGSPSLDEPYEKLDATIRGSELDALRSTFVSLEMAAILDAGRRAVSFFHGRGTAVAAARGLPYPTELDRIMRARLDALDVERPTHLSR